MVSAIAFAALYLYSWERVWTSAFGNPDLGPVEFADLQKGSKPNQALICPPNLCDTETVDHDSPVYAVSADQLRAELLKSLDEETDLEQVDDRSQPLKMRFIQRSKLMRYPDTIRVQVIPIDEDTSTLAIYSQSQIGESDFGVNLERADRWLSRLEKFQR